MQIEEAVPSTFPSKCSWPLQLPLCNSIVDETVTIWTIIFSLRDKIAFDLRSISWLSSGSAYDMGTIITPYFTDEQVVFREVNKQGQTYMPRKKWSQDFNPGCQTLQPSITPQGYIVLFQFYVILGLSSWFFSKKDVCKVEHWVSKH